MEHLIEDKNRHIKELGHQLKLFDKDRLVSEPLPHPPGIARRTASIAVQASRLEVESPAPDQLSQKFARQESTDVSSGDAVSVVMAPCVNKDVIVTSLKQ